MSQHTYNLVIVTFNSPEIAAQGLSQLDKLYLQNKVALSDYVQVSKIDDGELMLRQAVTLSLDQQSTNNGLWPSLASLLYWSENAEGVVKIGLNLLREKVISAGINQKFLDKVTEAIKTSSDGLFALVKQEHFDAVVDSLKDLDANLYYTTLNNESLTSVLQALKA